MFATGLILNDSLNTKHPQSLGRNRRVSALKSMRTLTGIRRPSGQLDHLIRQPSGQIFNQKRSSQMGNPLNDNIRRASQANHLFKGSQGLLNNIHLRDTDRDLINNQLKGREREREILEKEQMGKLSKEKYYGSQEEEIVNKSEIQGAFMDHGGNPQITENGRREEYLINKKYSCCPCISRIIKKQKSIFGVDPIIKARNIHEMWRNAIKKVILINRVFYTMKELNRDIKLYGVTNRNTASKIESKKEHAQKLILNAFCIIMPESQFKLFWSMIMILLLLITMIYVPYRTAFIDEPPLWLMICEYIMDSLFAIDIILCFFSSYYDDQDNLVIDHFTIVKNYIKGWFFLDVIATFPFGLLEDGGSSGGGYNKLLRLLRLPRLYRLIKILRLLKMVKVFKYSNTYEKISFYLQMNAGLVRLLKALAYMLFFVHFYGCVWFWFAKLGDFGPQCWVARYELRDASQGAQYLASVYWVLTTATTVGYGDIHPATKTERGLAIILMVFGVGFYSYTVGNLSAILNTMDYRNQELFAKMFALNQMGKHSEFPESLVKKVQKILTDNHELHLLSSMDTEELLSELPIALRTQVIMYLHKKTLSNIVFFWNKDPAFLTDVTSFIKKMKIGDGELIYKNGDPAEAIYFITKGRVRMIDQDGYIYRTYVEGSLFGEYEALNEPYIRNHYALTYEDTELMILYQNDLFDLLEKYPEIKLELDAMASLRAEKNEEALNLAKKGDIRLNQIEREIMMTNPNFVAKTNDKMNENLEERMTMIRSATLTSQISDGEQSSRKLIKRSPKYLSKLTTKSKFLDPSRNKQEKPKKSPRSDSRGNWRGIKRREKYMSSRLCGRKSSSLISESASLESNEEEISGVSFGEEEKRESQITGHIMNIEIGNKKESPIRNINSGCIRGPDIVVTDTAISPQSSSPLPSHIYTSSDIQFMGQSEHRLSQGKFKIRKLTGKNACNILPKPLQRDNMANGERIFTRVPQTLSYTTHLSTSPHLLPIHYEDNT